MVSDYKIVNVISAADEAEIKEKVNGIVRTLCTLDIEKLINIDYNVGVAYWDGTSDFNEKEVSEPC